MLSLEDISDGKLSVGNFENGLRGVVANCRIGANEQLVSIDESHFLLANQLLPKLERCGSCSKMLNPSVYEMIDHLTEQQRLTLVLYHEILSDSSPWLSYLRTLLSYYPKYLSSLSDINQNFQSCGVNVLLGLAKEMDEIRRELYSRMERILVAIGDNHNGQNNVGDSIIVPSNLDRWLVCCHLVNTRVVSLPNKNYRVKQMAMIPWFDLFNHSDSVTVSSAFVDGKFILSTCSSVPRPGSQVFINYGPHSNLTLLLEYDFVLDKPVQHDVVPVDVSQLATTLETKIKLSTFISHYNLSLNDRKQLMKFFNYSLDGSSYYLKLLLYYLHESSGDLEVHSVQSIDEDCLVIRCGSKLDQLALSIKNSLLLDRNYCTSIVATKPDSVHDINFLVKLIDIWIDVLNNCI